MSENDAKKKRFGVWDGIVIVGVLLVIAGFIAPHYVGSWTYAYRDQCMNQLKQVYSSAVRFARASKDGAFPIAEGPNPRAHDSLNVLLAFNSEGLDPRFFRCPACPGPPAEADKAGKFVLDETTLDFAWTSKKLRLGDPKQPLAADKYVDGHADDGGKHDGHKRGMNVLYSDGIIRFVPEEELPRDPDPETGMAMLPRGLIR